ncbi:hypothetical protein C1H46_022507 [Malus baccata]|uniref:UDP-3-O-[3-hydroxymyristoyl] glucosamine N-acyltransferase non-repeat region domain-containing protein n=1 Tax=Malus baccata TaxID=106549 RepID=A0A540M064_MALBA|nr:hypothetical protein C1H46_022507 [Malus baccata]
MASPLCPPPSDHISISIGDWGLFTGAFVTHTRLQGNNIAHLLARHALHMESATCSWFKEPPDFILVLSRWNIIDGNFVLPALDSACIDPTVFIEFGAVVHSKSVVGEHVCIGSGAVIGPSVTVGQSTKIGYNVALSNCSIGDSCIIHNGVCIGQDGFGFMVDEHGNMLKKPQMLNARIGNHVEIGANTCVDRGSWRDTVVGDHSKIDNLVQIGHNVVIGKNCILCGLVGIAGSVTIGDYVTMGGRVAVRDHVSIVSKVRLAGMSCVTKDITEPGDYGGFPAVPAHQWRRQVTNYSRTSKQRNPGNH